MLVVDAEEFKFLKLSDSAVHVAYCSCGVSWDPSMFYKLYVVTRVHVFPTLLVSPRDVVFSEYNVCFFYSFIQRRPSSYCHMLPRL
jgi:hypothetical protein